MNQPENTTASTAHFGLIAAISLGLGALIQWILPAGNFWIGFSSFTLVLFLMGAILYLAWQWAGGEKMLAWIIFITLFLRLVYGVFLAWGLPRFGYPEPPQQAGFVFEDAYRRDRASYALSQSDEPVSAAFRNEFAGDQYGGLMALSATVYRYLSPDAHRPILITLLSAGAMALSVAILYAGLRGQFDKKIALMAGWIFALYPEGILLGSSQMREPFLILFFTLLIWSATRWMDRDKPELGGLMFVIGSFTLVLLSSRVALLIIGMVILWVWIIESPKIKQRWIKYAGWIIIGLGMVGAYWIIRDLVIDALHWDTLQTVARSGRIQFQLSALPEWLHFPFVFTYGLLQPVLPAAIAAPAPAIWWSLAIFRGLGWYILLPFLVYALFRSWRLEPSNRKRWLVVLILLAWIWVFISSARAGGDQWDNPRYRTIFLPFMVTAASWAFHYWRQQKDRWLGRALVIEVIFLVFFTQWYLSRYFHFFPRLNFFVMILVIFALSLGVIVGGIIRDRRKAINVLTQD